MKKNVANQKNTSSVTTSRRVSFKPFVGMSLITSVKDMTVEEKRRTWISTEDKISSQQDLWISILALRWLRCNELDESDRSISTLAVNISNDAGAVGCYRGIEHHKSKKTWDVRNTIKREHVASILREQQAYRLETGRSRGTPTHELAKLSHHNSRYSRERAIKLALRDEECVNKLLQEDKVDENAAGEANEKKRQQDHDHQSQSIQRSDQQSDKKKVRHQSKNVGIVQTKQNQTFPSCA